MPAAAPRRAGASRVRVHADPVRRAALDVLRAVAERDAYANLVLPGLLRQRGITGRDAALATRLAYGTLRGRLLLDTVLAACADRPLDRVDGPLLEVLRLGAYQLLEMRTPAHAAVSAAVDLARDVAGEGAARFANAVLRRVAVHDVDGWTGRIAPRLDEDPVGHLSVTLSHPPWVVRAFLDALDGDVPQVADVLRADNTPSRVTLVARPGRCSPGELLAAGALPGRWSPLAAVLPSGDPADVRAVAEGRAGVQDEGSQLVALALAAAPVEGPDRRWVDLCAGPGGKSALLAGVAAQRGAALLAVEVQPHRAALVRAALDGAPGAHAVVVADGTAPPCRPGSADRVLVDAPCTGLGALRRRPEARWRRRPEDLDALRPLQVALLRSALELTRPGGVAAYVTCSPHPAETRAVVAEVLAGSPAIGGPGHPGHAEPVDARPLLAGVPDLGDRPDVQLWPHRHDTDAMYLALLRRR